MIKLSQDPYMDRFNISRVYTKENIKPTNEIIKKVSIIDWYSVDWHCN